MAAQAAAAAGSGGNMLVIVDRPSMTIEEVGCYHPCQLQRSARRSKLTDSAASSCILPVQALVMHKLLEHQPEAVSPAGELHRVVGQEVEASHQALPRHGEGSSTEN